MPKDGGGLVGVYNTPVYKPKQKKFQKKIYFTFYIVVNNKTNTI